MKLSALARVRAPSTRAWSTFAALLLALAACAALAQPAPFVPVPEGAWSDLAIDDLHEQIFAALLARDPEGATGLGLAERYGIDEGRLNDVSDAYRLETLALSERALAHLEAVDPVGLSADQARSNAVFAWELRTDVEGRAFFWHDYSVRQLASLHTGLPTLLAFDHPLATPADAAALLARLEAVPTKFAQAADAVRARLDRGFAPPRFVFERVIGQLRAFAATPADQSLIVVGFDGRSGGIVGLDDAGRAALRRRVLAAIEGSVYPAYRELAAALEGVLDRTDRIDGVWRMPDGDAYYAYLLRRHTGTDLSAAEIHQLGLAEVARIEGELRERLRALGHSGSVAADARRFYGQGSAVRIGGDADRERALDAYRAAIDRLDRALGPLFGLQPATPLEVRRVPPFQEGGSPAYYDPPPLDGSRPGVFYVPLPLGRTVPLDGVASLSAHEGVPGHHFQLALQREAEGLPIFRRVLTNTGFVEGWALYSERLASERGVYDANPREEVARLLGSDLFRAARLVVDTGIHALGWSRQEAMAYMSQTLGFPYTSEIERYVAWPGQATGYKVGELTLLRLRAEAEAALGDAFDLAAFHDAILSEGSPPLGLLDGVVDDYIEGARGGR